MAYAYAPHTIRPLKRVEYEHLVEAGVFAREPIELIGGQLIVAEPQGTYHATAVDTVYDAIRRVLPAGWIVRNEKPVALDDDSEPEPDLAVVAGVRADYLEGHPNRPALVIEVAESSLRFDRRDKGSLYSRGGVQDYWIVNLVDRLVEVYREPAPSDAAPYGWSYRSVETFAPPSFVTSLALPSVRLAVADLLP